jgi:diketogulonate reductase-like aldo/keto reductase
MRYTTLNNNEIIPNLGIGTYRIRPTDAESSVEHALKNGYQLIDTANIYMNEKAVGRAIKKSGINRSEIFLTSKIWPTEYKYEKAKQAIETTLNRLGVDYLDLMLLHQPVGDYLGAWKAMEEAVSTGKIKAIGLSNFTGPELDKVLAEGTIKPAVVQVECHPYFQQKDLKAKLAKDNIALEAWYPIGSADKDLLAEPIFTELASKYNKSVVQIILHWHVQTGNIVIPGSKNSAHIDSNLNIFDFELTAADLEQISQMDKGKRFFNLPKWMQRIFLLTRMNYDKQA